MDALLDVRGGRDLETAGQVSLLVEVCCEGSWRLLDADSYSGSRLRTRALKLV